MESSLIGYHNRSLVFTSDITIRLPQSGFSFQIGRSGTPFVPLISFSGYSGYFFDQSGNLVGGYKKDEPLYLSGNYFAGPLQISGNVTTENSLGRFSFFLNNHLIANNIITTSGYFDTVRFDGYSGINSLRFEYTFETGSPVVLTDSGYVYLRSSEGYFLAGG